MSIRLGRILTATTLAAAITVTGCTTPDQPQPTDTTDGQTQEATPDGTDASPAAPELRDRSDLVVNFEFPTEPIAEATGAINLERDPAILRIYGLESSATTTRLIFQIISPEGDRLDSLSILTWNLMPMLDDITGGKRYFVNTITHRLVNLENQQLGLYLDPSGHIDGYAPLTAQYPPLPADLDTVEITMVGFDSITVPVTRR